MGTLLNRKYKIGLAHTEELKSSLTNRIMNSNKNRADENRLEHMLQEIISCSYFQLHVYPFSSLSCVRAEVIKNIE